MRPWEAPRKGVLLVSHDRNLRRQVHACLSSVGIATRMLTTVRHREEYLAALVKVWPRLVVLDDSTSDLDGPELLRALHQRAPEVLVIYLTTHHTLELERTVRQLGLLYYTEKPPDSSSLEKVFASVFAAAAKTIGESRICWRGTWSVH